jgi:hypothetical protein
MRGSSYHDPLSRVLIGVKCRILIIVQNLPVPCDRRVWLECQALTSARHRVAAVCPKGSGDPAYEVVDTAELYKYPLNDVSTMNEQWYRDVRSMGVAA